MSTRSISSCVHRLFSRVCQHQNRCSVRFINNDGETYYKSHLNLLTKEDDNHTYVDAFSPIGFRLSSGLRILGPCALFPKTVLHWNVVSAAKITPESLSLFSILEPKPDVLIIGIGEKSATYDKNIIKFLRSKRINVEILPTEQACSTFNFLNAERRVVIAALIPPQQMDAYSTDSFVIEEMDDAVTRTKDGQIPTLENPIDDATAETMEKIRTDGMMKTLLDKDWKRQKRAEKEERLKQEKEQGLGNDGDSKDRKQ